MSWQSFSGALRAASLAADAAIGSGVGLVGYLQSAPLGPVASAAIGLVAAVLAAGASAFVSTYIQARMDGQSQRQALALAEQSAALVARTTALELAHDQLRELGHEPRVPAPGPGAVGTMTADERRQMIEDNLGLVVPIARKYQHSGAELADLIGWGNLGLIRAVDRFEPERGLRFSTYARYWIRALIGQALYACERLIDLPLHASRLEYLHHVTAHALAHELGRAPTFDEVCDRIEAAHSARNDTIRKSRRWRQVLADALRAGRIEGAPVVGPDEDAAPDPIGVDDAPPVGSELEQADQLADLRHRLDTLLSPHERQVLSLRYGLDGRPGPRPTFAQIAVTMGLTRQGVQAAERRALARLAEPSEGGQESPCSS